MKPHQHGIKTTSYKIVAIRMITLREGANLIFFSILQLLSLSRFSFRPMSCLGVFFIMAEISVVLCKKEKNWQDTGTLYNFYKIEMQ